MEPMDSRRQQRSGAVNVIGWVLYVVLLPIAGVEFLALGLAFGMSTDACYDAACDARYHPNAAISVLTVGIVVVLVATAAMMSFASRHGHSVVIWPFLGLAGLATVGAIAFVIVGG